MTDCQKIKNIIKNGLSFESSVTSTCCTAGISITRLVSSDFNSWEKLTHLKSLHFHGVRVPSESDTFVGILSGVVAMVR